MVPDGITSEDLALQVTQKAQDYIRGWYSRPGAEHVMNATNKWQLAFTWDAEYKDGSKFRQYDEVSYIRTLQDPDFTPDISKLVSSGSLDKKQTVRFTYHPTAFTRKNTPWYSLPYVLTICPDKGERLLAFWEVDYRPRDGFKLYRHAIGIAKVDPSTILENGDEKEICRSVLVLSPSGSMSFANSTNVSFEGE
jgi:hypothetical protein